ncbi:heavy-metal-associated domain-containing protein [Deinococcus sp.]|uniref:CopZ family metallochaperone n=1 Tax=Deinococcus sp. TaxID=47478 RepID=UPI0025B8D24C|nr:heavy metal-associated domain-containing protein [Deinococcus sp.]
MQTELKVTGMSCGHCVSAVEKAIKSVPGVKSVLVNLQEGKAVIEGDADSKALVAAIMDEGYGVELS